MTNDKHPNSQQAIQEAFNELLMKASKEEVHTLCIGDFQKKNASGGFEGNLIIAGNYGDRDINRPVVHLLLRAIYGIFENSTEEDKEEFQMGLLHLYLTLATGGDEVLMEKVEDLLTTLIYAAANAVEIKTPGHSGRQS
ncbi:hypothetical protein ACT26D_06040 [Megasphaera elsdenii]|uniref:hypothetical protein n=1 Tax=Megasphaera TaxID=906 RepID=UPI00307EDE3B